MPSDSLDKGSERTQNQTPLNADRPIQQSTDDLFRRADFASAVAQHAGSAADGQSLVFALTGAWGAGKTSVLHMMEERLREKKVEVIWFNPWLFSGPEQIASQFMRELGLQLGSKDRDFGRIGKMVESYGKILEVGGAVFSGALRALGPVGSIVANAAEAGVAEAVGGALKTSERESVRETRERIERSLREGNRRIIVFVDDIDRLDGSEIRTVFKLVRLVADFPNISYVLAFDRARVERALGTEDLTGRAYLAKIVQASFDLPPLDPGILSALLPLELDRCLAGRTHGPFHKKSWPDILVQVIRPLVRHPRDVRRYLNAVAPAVDMLGEEVALEDVLALEAVRVFLPDVYEGLTTYADVLAMGPSGPTDRHYQRDAAKARMEDFFKLAGEHSDVARNLCKFVFPMSRFAIDNHHHDDSSRRGWRRDRRVASSDILNVYLERSVRPGAARASQLRRLVEAFADESAVDCLLRELQPEDLEAALHSLEDYSSDLAKIEFENGMVAMYRHADRLRRGRTQPFDMGADMVVSRLVLWTLRSVKDTSRRLEAFNSIMGRTDSYSWRYDLLESVERHEERDAVIDESVTRPLLKALKAEVLEATPERLMEEREPYLVARMAHDEVTKTYDPRLPPLLEHMGFFRNLLTRLLSDAMSWGFDSVALNVRPSLPWDFLKAVSGGEDQLRRLLQAALEAGPAPEGDDRMAKTLQLVEDVLAGRKKMIGPEQRPRDEHDEDD